MADPPVEGSADSPVRLDPWHRIVEVHWSTGILAQVDFTRTNRNGFSELLSIVPPGDGDVGLDLGNDPAALPGISIDPGEDISATELKEYRIWEFNRLALGEVITVFEELHGGPSGRVVVYSLKDQFLVNFSFPPGAGPISVEEVSVAMSTANLTDEDLITFASSVRVRVYSGGKFVSGPIETLDRSSISDEADVSGFATLANVGGTLLWDATQIFDWKTTGELCRFNRTGFI